MDDTPDTEEVAETINLMVADDTIIDMATDSNYLEFEVVKTDWRYYITADEIRLVALIAELEDRNAMQEVAEVILNRVLSPKFPDSVGGVIFQPKQFQAVGLITDDMIPSDGAVQAVEAVFRNGQSTVSEALFFAEKSISASSIAKNLDLIEERGHTNFYGQK